MTLTDEQVLNNQDSREMMLRPKLWGLWPRLCLKRWTGPGPSLDDLQCGILLDQEEESSRWTVFLTNVYMPKEDCEKLSYTSVDELLADGWVVD